MNRQEKIEYVEGLKRDLESAELILLTRFTGLDVPSMTEFRAKLREVGTSYRVVKNTLLRRAAEGTPCEDLVADLKGPVAIAFTGGDAVCAAKAVTDFAKVSEHLVVEAGLLSGKALLPDQVKAIAELPSLDQLRAQLLATMLAVPQKLLRVLSAPARDLVGVLEARKRALEEAA